MFGVRAWFASLASCLFLLGCSSDVKISGQIFIDNATGAERIAQAAVAIYREDEALRQLREFTPKIGLQCEKAAKGFVATKRELLAKNALLDTARQIGGVAADVASTSLNIASASGSAPNSKLASLALAGLREAQNDFRQARESFSRARLELNGIASGGAGRFYSSAFTSPAFVTATSDVDGKFTANLTVGERYLMVATKGERYWFIWLTPAKEDHPVLLTNTNLSDSNCEVCLFNSTLFESKLSFVKKEVDSCTRSVDGEEIAIGDHEPKWLHGQNFPKDGNFLLAINICEVIYRRGNAFKTQSVSDCSESSLSKIPESGISRSDKNLEGIIMYERSYTATETRYRNRFISELAAEKFKDSVYAGSGVPLYKIISRGRVRVTDTNSKGCSWVEEYYFQGKSLFVQPIELSGACASYEMESFNKSKSALFDRQFSYSLK